MLKILNSETSYDLPSKAYDMMNQEITTYS